MKRFFSLRTWLLGFLFLLLCLPALEQRFGFIESGSLYGVRAPAPDTVLTPRGWWNGRYQEVKTAWLNDNTGFYNDFIRLNNQLDYSLFGKMHAAGVVMGKAHHFYQKEYIDAYCGLDLTPEAELRGKFRKLQAVAQYLRSKGKPLLLILTPSQARYYPEYFPAEWEGKATGHSNLETVRRLAPEYGIAVLDVNGWFTGLRGKGGCNLMAPYGIHWTGYGAMLAADSINKCLAAMLKRPAVRSIWKDTLIVTRARNGDNDIENLSNLIWPLPPVPWCYPNVEFQSTDSTAKPSPVFISDSFFWTLLASNIPQGIFDRWQFWSYFHDVWNSDITSGRAPARQVRESDWFGELEQYDAVVIMSTEINLNNFGFGFIEAAYDKIGQQQDF